MIGEVSRRMRIICMKIISVENSKGQEDSCYLSLTQCGYGHEKERRHKS